MSLSKLIQVTTISIVSGFYLMGYATASTNDHIPENVSVKVQGKTIDTQIIRTSAKQDNKSLVVSGVVRRLKDERATLPVGCVDISVSDKQGKVIGHAFTKSSSVGTYGGGAVETAFKTQIPMIAPQGSLVSVKFHNGPHGS